MYYVLNVVCAKYGKQKQLPVLDDRYTVLVIYLRSFSSKRNNLKYLKT